MDAFHFFFMEKKISKLTAVVIVGGLVKFRKIIGLVPVKKNGYIQGKILNRWNRRTGHCL